jgi:DNA polymerase-1
MSQLDHFRTSTGNYSFNDKNLEKVEGTLPVAGTIRQYRKVMRLVSDQTFSGKLIGADGRLHPLHRQLGTETGRNGMRNPNIGGIGKMLRPIVVPDEGYQIGEVDLSQIEPGIAAAWFRDPHLIKMFNTGDIYSAIVRRYYADVLTADDQRLPDREFKRKFSTYRDRMKIFTLATIYNITPHGLGLRLGISTASASEQQRKFLELFPVLARALREASEYGIIRGSAYTISGLRRHRVRAGLATTWEENWLRNAPIQGSAAVVFKVAGNRLARRYRYYGARLILPLHDAYVFETPVGTLDEVAEVTRQVMTSVVQEYFPALNPQAEVNILDPTCWNKDGKGNSLREWLIAAEDIDIIED